MKSYTELRTDYGIDTKNTNSANLTFGDRMMNDFHRRLLSKADWPFLHRLRTATTQASITFVPLPYDTDLVESVFVTVDSRRYSPKPAPSRKFWDELHLTDYTSDIPEYWYVYDQEIGIWPKPATAGNVISLNCKVRAVDLNVADYTTGTITTATNADQTIVGDSTVWTSPMVGRWLRITADDGTDSGDGTWYEISSVTNNTNLELVRNYGGTSISAGSQAYKIGMMPLLPEAYHDLPEIYAAYRYWTKEKDSERASTFKSLLNEGVGDLFTSYGFNDLSMVVQDGRDDEIINPNLTITL